jgi:hypothetical protein
LPRQSVSFSLHDEVEGREITPENVDLLTLHQAHLIDVVKPSREVDEDKLKALWQKGKEAWAGISSPTEWVEQLR